ncbi:MAG: chromate transporter [Treponema sp.]|nr:chromate transporter [Treponema sp.]
MLKSLLELYFVFFRIGAVTFGGGYAMLPILERELVTKRGWTTNDDLLDYYAISQVTPGVIAVNVSTFVGYKHKKIPGAIFATAGIVSPSIIIITLIALFISNFEDIIWVQKALRGINVGVSALLTYSVLTFAKKTIKKWWNMIFYLAAFIAVFFFKIPSFLVVIASILGGLAIGFFSGNLKKINKDEEHRNVTNNATQTEEKN